MNKIVAPFKRLKHEHISNELPACPSFPWNVSKIASFNKDVQVRDNIPLPLSNAVATTIGEPARTVTDSLRELGDSIDHSH